MNPDPTTTVSCDYFIELSDDGTQPDQPEPQIILMPPASTGPAFEGTPGEGTAPAADS